ncbi:MAG: hypothetical protein JXM70_27125 [Pirellulales bacterium]|nr:hypothetical protein [Pirellulales bacterium]
MQKILFEYYIEPTTWVYLSSLMTIGIYFKFRRFWSIRNVDLMGLIAFAPGLLLVSHNLPQWGYTWLLAVGVAFVVRLLLDSVMVRRPLLEPNLSVDGLTFAAAALLVFLIANIITGTLSQSDLEAAHRIDELFAKEQSAEGNLDLTQHPPGLPLFFLFSTHSDEAFEPPDAEHPEPLPPRALKRAIVTRTTAIVAQLAVVLGLVLIGYRHFDSVQTGVAMAALYLLLPYTTQTAPRIDHAVPAALLVWAVEAYRRPFFAGVFLGSAVSVTFYPVFLLPLWCGFYWQRGFFRFLIGTGFMLALIVSSLPFTSTDMGEFWMQLKQMFGAGCLSMEPIAGFWRFHPPVYRIPVAATYAVVCFGFALWPHQKNLGTLLSCSATVMLGAQFWNDPRAGIYYMAWFLPLLLLTIFRPNLEDRVALAAVKKSWFARKDKKRGQ